MRLNTNIQPSTQRLRLMIGREQDTGGAGLLWYCIERGYIMSVGPWGNVSDLCLWSCQPKAIGFRSGCVDSALLGPQCPLGAKHRLSSPSSLIYITSPQRVCQCLCHTPPGSWAQTNLGKSEGWFVFASWKSSVVSGQSNKSECVRRERSNKRFLL